MPATLVCWLQRCVLAAMLRGLAAEGEARAGKSPFAPMSINLSSQSTASNTVRIIESYLLKRRRGVLGPPVGKVRPCLGTHSV